MDLPDGGEHELERGLWRPSRRTAIKTAVGGAVAAGVWYAPRIEGLSIVPGQGAAASPLCQVPVLAPYTQAQTPASWQAGSGALGFFAAGTAPAPYNAGALAGLAIYLVEADPPAGVYTFADTPGSTTYTSSGFTLTPGSVFTFTFNVRWRDTNNHVAVQRVEAQWATSLSGPWTTEPGASLTTSLAGAGDNIHDVTGLGFSLTITSSNAGTYFFRYRHTFSGTIGTATNARANDIGVSLPTITCV